MDFFSGIPNFSNSTARLLSRVQLLGTQGVHQYTTAQVGSRPGSMARALHVESREIRQVIAGLLSGQLQPIRPM